MTTWGRNDDINLTTSTSTNTSNAIYTDFTKCITSTTRSNSGRNNLTTINNDRNTTTSTVAIDSNVIVSTVVIT